MSVSGTALAVKAAIMALTDEKTWKGIGIIVGAICVPFILLILLFMSLQSAMVNHNNTAIDMVFNNKSVSSLMPRDYKEHIKDMKKAFKKLDSEIEKTEAGLDSIRVKSIFYALFFKEEVLFETELNDEGEEIEIDKVDYEGFVNAFLEEDSLPEIYEKIEDAIGVEIKNEDKANASEIYYRILYGSEVPTYGESFDGWFNSVTGDIDFESESEFNEPISGWRDIVTSEYGTRIDPITKKISTHTGIDLGAVKGTEICASKSGIVKFVRYKTTGYGYHVAIEHGNGQVTLYAHCSKILVTEGEEIQQGQTIAEVGSTGKSTGNHLHFEIRIDGKTKNPRNYLD